MVTDYKELLVWQKSMEMVKQVYKLVKLLPREEMYALSDQLRRAVVSIPSNIAEGSMRQSTKEFLNFLAIASGSKAEVETQLMICVDLDYVTQAQIDPILSLSNEIGRMTTALVSKLRAKL